MRLPIYLDYMATTPVAKQVKAKMVNFLSLDGVFGNPASNTHQYGWQAREAVELARTQVASLINADPKEIIWTSGATEANNLAIKGVANFYYRKGKHIITSKLEHKSVLDTCEFLASKGFEITYLTPLQNGLLDLNQLREAIREDTILVSIMLVNNEIGVIQDIAAISNMIRQKGIVLHVDAAQATGKIPIDVQDLGADLMSFSAHKAYGPKGIGALYIRFKPRIRLEPQMHGGKHEFGLRAGTLATHQIVAMGEAFKMIKENFSTTNARIKKLAAKLLTGIRTIDDIVINGSLEKRVPHNLNVSFARVRGVDLIPALKDIAISAGSACDSFNIAPSHVLRAIGLSGTLAYSTIRISLGNFTTDEEISYTIEYIRNVIGKLRT